MHVVESVIAIIVQQIIALLHLKIFLCSADTLK